jgi:hypothetical protein
MKITVFLFLVAGLTRGSAQQATQDLSRYAGLELRKLTTNQVVSFQAEVKARTGTELGEKWGWLPLAPWLLTQYDAGAAAWVLVEAYPGYNIPDVSGMKVHFFDKSWTSICGHSFPTGYRFFLNDVSVRRPPQFDRPLIVAKVTSAGPFITSPGPKRPAFEQGDFQLQYYALLETNLFMVRLEDNRGVLARNHYLWSAPPKGPPVPTRTKAEWIACLDSSNVVQQLSALVWLTGTHLSSSEERKADQNQESVKDSRSFESVRDDPRTTSVMNRLRKDKNPWVQDYARLGIVKEDGN